MVKRLLFSAGFTLFFFCNLNARTYTETEGRNAWKLLRKQPLTEKTFRETCDLLQDIGQTNIALSYELLAEYVPDVRKTNNRQWLHVLLMGWAKAKESLTAFNEAETLYQEARANATGNIREYNESLVGTILMYLEWSRKDSLQKYLSIGETSCKQTGDLENLSFVYTFRALFNMGDTVTMRKYLDSAISAAKNISNKNALFTALYNRAIFYSQFDLQRQAAEFEELMAMSKDSSLSRKPRLYERTAFTFRNGVASIYYQLILINLLLTDYDNAWKFAELFYDATIKSNPSSPQAPYFKSVMALVKAYQGNYPVAKNYLSESLSLFHRTEDSVTYPTYQLAAGMISAQEGRRREAMNHFKIAYENGDMSFGLHLMPPAIYYAHELIVNQQLEMAENIFRKIEPILQTRKYSAIGFYYYKYYAELLSAKKDPGYNKAMAVFYAIKDSLASINRYRAIQEIETRMRVREKELQIRQLNDENIARQKELRQERVYLLVFTALFAVIVLLLVGYGKNQRQRKLQAERITKQNDILQQNQIVQMEKQHRIDIMQSSINAEESERRKIADQLHDEAGTMLALATLNISSVIENGTDDRKSEEKIIRAQEILTGLSATIRDISHRLTPLVIEKEGFKKAVTDLSNSVDLSKKINIQTVIIGFDNDQRYPVSLLNDLYRIVQELIHNILKHSGATDARMELVEHDEFISLIIEDNGRGIPADSLPKGKGLTSIRARIAYLNGKMETMNKKEGGALFVIEINTINYP